METNFHLRSESQSEEIIIDEVPREETSILDRKPIRVFGYPLTTIQQMWLGYLLPASISTIIFIINFALDIAVTCQLFKDGHPLLASATLSLIYAPSIVCLILTFVNGPRSLSIDLMIWASVQFLHCMLFPAGLMYRFATRIFWSIVALTEKDPEREKALHVAVASHHTELFFFLNSFLNAAPQAILQAYILLSPQIPTQQETAWTQVASIVTSVMALSKTTALYQRFESQRVVGRQVPWSLKPNEEYAKALVQISKLDPIILMELHKTNQGRKQEGASQFFLVTNLYHTKEKPEPQNTSPKPGGGSEQTEPQPDKISKEDEDIDNKDTGEEYQITPFTNILSPVVTREEINDDRGNSAKGDLTEIQQQEVQCESIPQDHDYLLQESATGLCPQRALSHHSEPISTENTTLEDRCFWPRIYTPASSPTADPHMRPRLSINTIINSKRPVFVSQTALPVRKPQIKGLNEDEPLGLFTAFHAWEAYLLGRILVIAAFAHFYQWSFLGLMLVHYAIMTAYICFCDPCSNVWAPLLGLIFILCPIEVKIQYKYPRLFLVLFFVLVFLEDLSTVVLWYCGAEWESWWYDFAFFFIIGCHVVAAINAALYLFMFKPKTKFVV